MSGSDRDETTGRGRSRRRHDETPAGPDAEEPGRPSGDAAGTAPGGRTALDDDAGVTADGRSTSDGAGDDGIDDGTGDATSADDARAAVPRDVDALAAELEAARTEAARLKEDWLRALAEADNTRKRSAREIEEQSRRAREQVLAEFVAVVDDVERALTAIGAPPTSSPTTGADADRDDAGDTGDTGDRDASGDADAAGTAGAADAAPALDPSLEGIVAGLTLIHSRFIETLARFDVKPMASENTPFDPHLHEAVMRQTRDGVEPDQVIQVIQKGYWIGDRVLRPARVVVSG
jgi:molecular chaperone GrpE